MGVLLVIAAVVAAAGGLVVWRARRRRMGAVPIAVLKDDDTERIAGSTTAMRRARLRLAHGTPPPPFERAQAVSGEIVEPRPDERDLASALKTVKEWPDLGQKDRRVLIIRSDR